MAVNIFEENEEKMITVGKVRAILNKYKTAITYRGLTDEQFGELEKELTGG